MIKTALVGLVFSAAFLSFFLLPSCQERDEESYLGWPDGAEGLVDHLNGWDVKELTKANEGEWVSDETRLWIERHLYELHKINARCDWSTEFKCYKLVNKNEPTR